MRASMKDVAKEAGVSVATVSNTISGNKYVSPELKKTVFQAIEKLGYKPSKLARSLKSNRTSFIGLLIPDITNPYFAEIARGVERISEDNDFQLFLCNTDGEVNRERKIIETFKSQHVEGIINVAPRMKEKDLKESITDTPFVILDREVAIDDPLLDVIFMCNEKGAKQVAKHFIDKGHKRYACIAGPQSVTPAKKRLKGFRDALLESGIPDDMIDVYYGDFKYESGYQQTKNLLKSENKTTALFASNDLMAWGAVEAIKEQQLNIPGDISVIGYDNIFIARLIVPALTTVHQTKYSAGKTAMNYLFKKIDSKLNGGELIHNVIELNTKLVVRYTA